MKYFIVVTDSNKMFEDHIGNRELRHLSGLRMSKYTIQFNSLLNCIQAERSSTHIAHSALLINVYTLLTMKYIVE